MGKYALTNARLRKEEDTALLNNKKREWARNVELFGQGCKEAESSALFLVRASDLYPVHISAGFQRVFGVEPERLEDDIETLYRFVPDEDRLSIKRQLTDWNRTSPLNFECDYQMPTASKPGATASTAASASGRSTPAPVSSTGVKPTASASASSADAAAGATTKHFRVRITPVLEDSHLLVEVVDITSEHARLVAAAEERRQALASAREHTDFMSQMSHEIRTPLSGIKGLIGLARSHAADPDRLQDDLARANELSNYLLSLINDVLDMSRLNSGHVELEQLPFDVRLTAQNLKTMFEVQAADKGLTFTVNTDDCIHPYLVGDRMRLNQIVVNFVSNALKFTEAGGLVEVTLREMYASDSQVSYMVRVRDTGKGMDPRFVSRIFKPFEQEDQTIARRFGGTGLGMAITSGLVELMGGKIVVDTELGRGSDFTAYIPFRIATPEQAAELVAAGDSVDANTQPGALDTEVEYSFAGKRFLFAEDNELNAMIVVEILGNLGAEAIRADDGPVVVEMFEKSAPNYYDAILMDIQMPTYNGWEAARRIRALDRPDAATIPIIALSANNYVEDARRSREAGMDGHTGKPIDFAALKAELAAATAERAYKGRD